MCFLTISFIRTDETEVFFAANKTDHIFSNHLINAELLDVLEFCWIDKSSYQSYKLL